MKASIEWKNGMTFDASVREHHFILDSPDFGGKNLGPTPKETLVTSILGCTGMDVVGLLRKFRIDLKGFSLSGNAQTREFHPKIFNQVDIVFDLKIDFKDRDPELLKVIEAVELSLTKYCGVSAMIAPTSPLFYTVRVNGEIEGRGQADFTKASKT